MQSKHCSLPLHFFGNVWLGASKHFLDEDQYNTLLCVGREQYSGRAGALPSWDIDRRFDVSVHEETEAWAQRGIQRPVPTQSLSRPSGSIAACMAHRFLGPAFCIANPYSQETEDPNSPTIYLLRGERILISELLHV
ncbi:hypothetical protein BJX61DRAFT_510518 [Aspergillus egyptiacus]|nr:hypothetical protein BJX61DRAFT_510518 [Aspergillus egyptiacus]